jgi:hypothetical protein
VFPPTVGPVDLGGERVEELGHVTGSGGAEEGAAQPLAVCRVGGTVRLPAEPGTSAARHLSGVGLRERERASDLAERIIEGLAEHVDGALHRGQPFEQEPEGGFEQLSGHVAHERATGVFAVR